MLQRALSRLRYRLFESQVRRASFDRSSLAIEGYYSQCGQDKWVAEVLFDGKRDGVFVDIGAHDGLRFSNTAFLERELGWTGLAVEPIPEVFAQLERNRTCITVNGCVGSHDGVERFRVITGYAQMLSGIVGEYGSDHLDRIESELAEHGGSSRDIEVPCYRLAGLLERLDIRHIDYLSIDVEGGELAIINNFDFSQFDISVVGIENNYRDYRIPARLRQAGFHFHSVVGDEFYLGREFIRARRPE